jgi:hypothetical protein
VTARDLIELAGRQPLALLGAALLPPIACLLLSFIHGREPGAARAYRHVYAVLVYLACVPGVGAAVLTAYTLFFTRESLLDKDLLVYVAPVASMVVTLLLIRRSISFDAVPGFDRLSGLIVLIAVSFGILLAIRKTFIGILFGVSLPALLVVGAAVFGLLKWGARALSGGRRAPRA